MPKHRHLLVLFACVLWECSKVLTRGLNWNSGYIPYLFVCVSLTFCSEISMSIDF